MADTKTTGSKVSVIVPVYRAERFLMQCISSILHQSHKNIELILIDDASPDNCPQMCDCFAREDARVKVIHKENEGAAVARNIGIIQATGDYITFVDADDWLEPSFIEELVSIAQTYNTDAVVASFLTDKGGQQRCNAMAMPEGHYSKERLEKELYPRMLSASPFFTFGINAAMWAKLFRTSVAKKQTGLDYKGVTFGEDGCFTYSALLDCDSVYITHSARYVNRVNSESVTHTYNPKFMNETERLEKCLKQIAEDKQWEIGVQLDEYLAYVCWFAVSNILHGPKSVIKQYRKTLNRYVKTYFSPRMLRNKKILMLPLKKRLIYYLLACCCYQPLNRIINK